MEFSELAPMIIEQGKLIENWKKSQDAAIADLRSSVDEVEKRVNRPSLDGGEQVTQAQLDRWIDAKSRRPVLVLPHDAKLTKLASKPEDGVKADVGRFLRGMVLGGKADDYRELEDERKALGIMPDPSGGYTVQGTLALHWIDLLRANMVLSQAGARTVPMESNSLTIARVTSDPTVIWHQENASITPGEPTFGAVSLYAKTAVCVVRMSLELSQDSANIEDILRNTMVSAMASAIDSAGLNGVSVDAGAAPSGILNLSGRNQVTSIGTPSNYDFLVDGMHELMMDNVSLSSIGALIAHPKLWQKFGKLKTGIASDNTPLLQPADVAMKPKLFTTSCPEGTGIIADWRDLLFGVRQEIRVRVIEQAFFASNLQIAVVAFARLDFAAARPVSFCTLENITY